MYIVQFSDNMGGGRRPDGWQFLAFLELFHGFGSKNYGFTVPLFLNSLQISSQNMIREVKSYESEDKSYE